MTTSERWLDPEIVDGEIGIVIDYKPGSTGAIELLQGAAVMVEALDRLDRVLLSSIDSNLEPVSVVNDVQHSSLRLVLARVLKRIPDDAIESLEWKRWVGTVLVEGKHALLSKIDSDTPQIAEALEELGPLYQRAPLQLTGYRPPSAAATRVALDAVLVARRELGSSDVTIQTDRGDVKLPAPTVVEVLPQHTVNESITNRGEELFKVKQPDYLGDSQWSLMRGGRRVYARIAHREWLERWRAREFEIGPGDSLRAAFEETVEYDASGNELDRQLTLIEILKVEHAPRQRVFTASGYIG